MKAITLLLVLLALTTVAVVVAQPVYPVAAHVSANAIEPAWMLLSGATLLALASALRRLIP